MMTSRHGHAQRGLGQSPTYASWAAMKQRCTNPRATAFHRYGGRGIDFDPRWRSFDAFLADMGVRPLGTWLERTDNDAGYNSTNCRWATPSEQALNRSYPPACPQGHLFTPENTIGRRTRVCRACTSVRNRRARQARTTPIASPVLDAGTRVTVITPEGQPDRVTTV